ncbi:MAG: hypothetical protein GXZ11_05810 [Tissierellia bacterium]|nr:hypothetical protein [Tissierellia bacterium]
MEIHACLLGNWVCLNDDPDCKVGTRGCSPNTWYEENAEIWAPFNREDEHTYYQLNYVPIIYKGKSYRINPIFIQISEL